MVADSSLHDQEGTAEVPTVESMTSTCSGERKSNVEVFIQDFDAGLEYFGYMSDGTCLAKTRRVPEVKLTAICVDDTVCARAAMSNTV